MQPGAFLLSSRSRTGSSAKRTRSRPHVRTLAGVDCSVLYRPDGFDRLTAGRWDEGWVRGQIAGIVADADTTYDPVGLWPAEEWDSWQTPTPLKSLYVGASGVVWALGALGRRGHAQSALDLPEASRAVLDAWRTEPDLMSGIELPSPARAALLDGEAGILTVAWQLSPDDALADTLFERVQENADNEANELMWGSPGTMLAAHAMHAWTDEPRWAEAWQESADILQRRRDEDGLWTIHLYGETARGIGPAHGLVGNVLSLRQRLSAMARTVLERESAAALARFAVIEGSLANWPNHADGPLESTDGEIRLQWCAGAPGVVISATDYVDEELLLAGAHLIWQAGPHGDEKGASICHGTAGNGYALLKAFERTGDEEWLQRARQFAVHALEQVDRLHASRGRGRYSLWTGDVGTALFAADCLDARARYPILDTWA
jgi:Lanthionine synthetase C-like protein